MLDGNGEIYLLVSVDVIDSTKMKYSSGNIKNFTEWLNPLQIFFDEFPKSLNSNMPDKELKFRVSKFIGDEIFLYLDISDYSHRILDIIKALIDTVTAQNSSEKLKVKATVWTVHTPYQAFKIFAGDKCRIHSLDDSLEKEKYVAEAPFDFLGPHVDIGFRLSKFADRHKMIVSVDLAYMLLNANYQKLHFIAEFPLKGIDLKRGYPVIYIELEYSYDNIDEIEIHDLENKHCAPYIVLKDYCAKFLKEQGQPWYIPGNKQQWFLDVDEMLTNMKSTENEFKSSIGETIEPPEDISKQNRKELEETIKEQLKKKCMIKTEDTYSHQ